MFRSAEALFRPKSIAIVGASDSGYAKRLFDNLREASFENIYLVNPRRDRLWNCPVYKDYDALPAAPDLALAVLSENHVPDSLAKAAASGVKAAIIYASDFGEGGGAQGVARAEAVQAICREKGLRVCGPNCMGVISIRERMCLYPAVRVRSLPAGPVGVVFQSGGTFQYWLQQGAIRGLGFSYAVSSGNELDLDAADYINFMIDDPNTGLIACLLEGIRRPEAFRAAAEKALAARKPILVIKVGRSLRGQAATQTHTGSLAGDDDVFNALCEKLGIVRCADLDDLIETALMLQTGRVPAGSRVAMVGFSGGTKGMFLDFAADAGMTLAVLSQSTALAIAPFIDNSARPENPLDVGAAASRDSEKYMEICRRVLTDDEVDVLALQGQLPMDFNEGASDRVNYADLATAAKKPLVVFGRLHQNVTVEGRAIQERAGVPFLQGIPDAIRAIQKSVRYGEAIRRGVPRPVPVPRTNDRHDVPTTAQLLGSVGIALPRESFAANPEEAGAAAARLGFPVALKIISPQASHKTEVGGVALNLTDAIQVENRARAMALELKDNDLAAQVHGFLVQEMVTGVEMIVGCRSDPLYGPVLLTGSGGVTTEILKDVSIRLLPVSENDARDMLAELRAAPLLQEFRGRSGRDVNALIHAIVAMSALFLDHRHWIADIEINPLIVLEKGRGVRAVDLRIIPKNSA